MQIRTPGPHDPKPSEITPESVYRSRRQFLQQMGLAGIALASSACGNATEVGSGSAESSNGGELKLSTTHDMAGGERQTPEKVVTSYNNFYEFGTSKDEPAQNAQSLQISPWSVVVDGECAKPGKLALEELLKPYSLEERIYRHRCVEGWSIVVPWVGFPLADLLKRFEPNANAKYVQFFTLYDPRQMPETRRRVLEWPYREGLRIDEAMHPLAFVSVGMYGNAMPRQNGAPLRLTLPWKYGFKSIKSIVRISFVEKQPETSWNQYAPNEYGFYSNVNPNVDHPRWSQKTERRLGELFKRDTLMFNGYPEVASLYQGMDLRTYF